MAGQYTVVLKEFRSLAGLSGAQMFLADAYENGNGVGQDFVRAYMWYSLSAAQGNDNAVKSRDALSAKMTAQQLKQAKAMAAKCKASSYKDCGE